MRILFLSSWFPYPPDNGSKIRIYNLLRALSRHHQVTLLTFANSGEGSRVDKLETFCRVAGVVPTIPFQPRGFGMLGGLFSPAPRSIVETYNAAMARLVEDELRKEPFDVLVASQISTAPYALAARLPRVFEEVETTVIRQSFEHSSSPLRRFRHWLTWSKLRRYMSWLVQQFNACTVVSEIERANLKSIIPGYENVHVIPNGVQAGLKLSDAVPQPNTLVFNGALSYNANSDAMDYFATSIWRHIRAEIPAATLKITGSSNGATSRRSFGEGIDLTGYLTDTRPMVAATWACVVPLRIGGGTRIKILEAMACGTPVVTTSKGAEGLNVTHEQNILIADDPLDFAAQTVRLLRDPALRQKLAENARQLIQEKYDWQTIGNRFSDLVESVGTGGSNGGL